MIGATFLTLVLFSGCNDSSCIQTKKPESVVAADCDPGDKNLALNYTFDSLDVLDSQELNVFYNEIQFAKDRAGNPNAALVFNGTDSYLEIDSGFDNSERTFSFWFKITEYPNGVHAMGDLGYLLVLDNPDLANGFVSAYVANKNGKKQLTVGMGSISTGCEKTIDMDAVGNPYGWHHLAFVQSGNSIKIYLDARLRVNAMAKSLINSNSGTHGLLFGTNRDLTGRFFSGAVDDFLYYDRALTECEIKYLSK